MATLKRWRPLFGGARCPFWLGVEANKIANPKRNDYFACCSWDNVAPLMCPTQARGGAATSTTSEAWQTRRGRSQREFCPSFWTGRRQPCEAPRLDHVSRSKASKHPSKQPAKPVCRCCSAQARDRDWACAMAADIIKRPAIWPKHFVARDSHDMLPPRWPSGLSWDNFESMLG